MSEQENLLLGLVCLAIAVIAVGALAFFAL
jgi:hypothetical protein